MSGLSFWERTKQEVGLRRIGLIVLVIVGIGAFASFHILNSREENATLRPNYGMELEQVYPYQGNENKTAIIIQYYSGRKKLAFKDTEISFTAKIGGRDDPMEAVKGSFELDSLKIFWENDWTPSSTSVSVDFPTPQSNLPAENSEFLEPGESMKIVFSSSVPLDVTRFSIVDISKQLQVMMNDSVNPIDIGKEENNQ